MSPISQLTASFMPLLLDVSIKSTAILALAWAGTSLMRGKSAAARHLVWLTAVLATLCLPVLALLLPSWRALPASMDVPSRLAVFPALTALPTSSGANSVPQRSDSSASKRASRSIVPRCWRVCGAAEWRLLCCRRSSDAGDWLDSQLRARTHPTMNCCARRRRSGPYCAFDVVSQFC